MSESMTRRRFIKIGGVAAGAVVLGGGAAKVATLAPEAEKRSTRMGDGKMKALVVYGTKTGCTEGVAEKIGQTLAARGASVEVKPAEGAGDAAGYDMVVVGSGVRMGQWHEAVRTCVTSNADALKGKPTAFYTCCLTLAQWPEKTDEVRAYTDPLIEATGVKPVDVGLFAGWNEPKKFSFVERLVMKAMKAPQGDFRDFAAVEKWTEDVAGQMGLA